MGRCQGMTCRYMRWPLEAMRVMLWSKSRCRWDCPSSLLGMLGLDDFGVMVECQFWELAFLPSVCASCSIHTFRFQATPPAVVQILRAVDPCCTFQISWCPTFGLVNQAAGASEQTAWSSYLCSCGIYGSDDCNEPSSPMTCEIVSFSSSAQTPLVKRNETQVLYTSAVAEEWPELHIGMLDLSARDVKLQISVI